MDKQLHLHILDVLQQNNAVDKMVDIKAAFATELETTKGRKHLKAQLELLVNEGLIETGKFDFLGWELLNGLYQLDNKKIEARLIGKWQSFLSKRSAGIKRQTVILPPSPEPLPIANLKLYDTPTTGLPYPGVNLNNADTPQIDPADEPFKADTPEIKPRYLNEDDFLPFKSRRAIKVQHPNTPPANAAPPENPNAPQELKPLNSQPFTYTAPKTGQPEPLADTDFTDAKSTYTPPRADVGDIAVIVTPFKPAPPEPLPEADKPGRIQVTRNNVAEEPQEPVFTSRATTRALPQDAAATVEARPQPASFLPPAAGDNYDDVHLPPPTINYAAIRFDTENNPFNGLGTIDLTGTGISQTSTDYADTDKKPRSKTAGKIITGIILGVIVLIFIILKIRYKF
jgi:hypothetical protein